MPTIFAKDIKKAYKKDTPYYAAIVDANNETLANTTVIFYVNGVTIVQPILVVVRN